MNWSAVSSYSHVASLNRVLVIVLVLGLTLKFHNDILWAEYQQATSNTTIDQLNILRACGK